MERVNNKKVLYNVLLKYKTLIAFLVLFAIASIVYDGFLTSVNMFNFLRQSSFEGILAISMTYVILTGCVDLSVGAITALSCVLTACFINILGENVPFFVPLVIVLAIGAVFGLLNGVLVARLKIPAFIATFAVMMIARGINYVISDSKPVSIKYLSSAFVGITTKSFLFIPVPAWILIIFVIISALISKYSGYGRKIYAVGGNSESAFMMGVNETRIRISVFLINGISSGFVGYLLASRLQTGMSTACNGWEMNAIAAVAVGGTQLAGGRGSFWGTLIGVYLIQTISSMINLQGNLDAWWQTIITGMILLAVAVVQVKLDNKKIKL